MKQFKYLVIKATPSTIRLLQEHESPIYKALHETGKYIYLNLPNFLKCVGAYSNNRPKRVISHKELQLLIMLKDNPEAIQAYLNKLIV